MRAELMAANPTWEQKNLSQALSLDPGTITKLLSPSKCTPAWQDALKAGQVSISDCYAASKLPADQQAYLLALKLRGASRDELEAEGRKRRNGNGSAVRISRLRCPLPSSKATVTLAAEGDGMTLDGIIEAAQELRKLAIKARDESMDAKTFVGWLRGKGGSDVA